MLGPGSVLQHGVSGWCECCRVPTVWHGVSGWMLQGPDSCSMVLVAGVNVAGSQQLQHGVSGWMLQGPDSCSMVLVAGVNVAGSQQCGGCSMVLVAGCCRVPTVWGVAALC